MNPRSLIRQAPLTSLLAMVLPAMALSACAAGPDYTPPTPPALSAAPFVSAVGDDFAVAEPETQWWRIYDDPALDGLITRALAANTDLRVALANLRAAEAVVAEAGNARLPQTSLSANGSFGQRQMPLFLPDARLGGSLGAELSYEADLFGRVSRTIEAARADVEAEAFAKGAVRLRVIAGVTQAYLAACTAAEAGTIARSSVDLAADSARITGLREAAGSSGRLDVVRAQSLLAQARAEVPPIQAARQTALFELAALMGLTPQQVPEAATQCERAPQIDRAIAVGDGAGLLRRRPDVAEAERRLAAATARIGVATADLYPSIKINASVAQAAGEGVSTAQGFQFGIGPLLSFSFPNTGAARARIRQSEARAEAALASFDGTVLIALKETEQALASYSAAVTRRAELAQAEASAGEAFDLANTRYRAGSIAYIDVIVAQRELATLRLARTQADSDLASGSVAVFRALGSGWRE